MTASFNGKTHSRSSEESSASYSGENRIPPLFKEVNSEDFKDCYDIKKILCGLKKHRLWIVLSTLLFGFLGGKLAYTFQNTYQAEAVVVYQKEDAASKSLQGGYSVPNFSLPTVLDMIKIPANFDVVKAKLGLNLDSEDIAKMVNVPLPKNDSNLIRIVARTSTPHLSTDIANTLAETAVQSSKEYNRKEFKKALDGYEEQLKVLRKKLSDELKAIEEFKIHNQYFDMQAEQSSFFVKVEEVRKQKLQADLESQGLQVMYENMQKELEKIPLLVSRISDPKQSLLEQRISNLHAALAESRSKYAPNNPKVLQLENELADLLRTREAQDPASADNQVLQKNENRDKLELELVQLKGKMQSAQKVQEEVAQRLNALEAELIKLPVKQMAFVKLMDAKERVEEQLKDAQKAVEAASLMVNSPKGAIEFYQKAGQAKPWKEGLIVSLLPVAGAIFGLCLGLSLAAAWEMKDPKIRTARQIDLAYSIPCMASIPEMPLLHPPQGASKICFFIRQLAEGIENRIGNRESGESILIDLVSSREHEGKSLIAYGLADYYCRLGHRVLLMTLDPKPDSFDPFNSSSHAAFAQYLKGEAQISDLIDPGAPDRMRLLNQHKGLKELLKSPAAQTLWKEIRSRYSWVLIDSPGIIEEDYATNLAEMADFRLFVIGSSFTSKHLIDEALMILEGMHARPHGIVLNRIDGLYITDSRIKHEIKKANASKNDIA